MNNIVHGEQDPSEQILETARENIDAQERIRDSLNQKKTLVLIDMRQITKISREAREYYAGERTASIQRS